VDPALAITLKALFVVTFAIFAVVGGHPLVSWLFKRVDASNPAEKGSTQSATIAEAGQLLRGGMWIGMLERLAIYACLLSGFAEGLAIVLAVKSLARYPELRSTTSGAAERFIIGTFTSVLFAAGCAGLCIWLIGTW
jgi:hypothetical protein